MKRVSLEPITTSVAMSASLPSASPSVVKVSASSARPTARAKATGVACAFKLRSRSNACDDAGRPRPRRRIIERDDEIAFGRGAQAPLDDRPRLEIVGKRDGAKIVAERRAEPGRRRLHRGHAGADCDVEREPFRILLDRLEHRRRHGEDARIAARDDRDRTALRREPQREAGAVEFGAIVAGVSALVRPQGQAVEIGAVTDDVGRGPDRRARLRRHPFGGPGAEPDDRDPPAHGRRPLPGARMSEK